MTADFARFYDGVIPWEKRLKRELPLLEELAHRAGRKVVIPACGTGGHVVALAQRGFDVLGFDADRDAVALARHKVDAALGTLATASGRAELRMLDMSQAGELGPTFDIAFILGNALPGISEPGKLLAGMRGVTGALRPGGLFFTQNLNYDLRWQEKTQFFPLLTGETEDEEILLVKFADYEAEFINFHAMFLSRPKSGGAWRSQVRSSRQVPLFRARILELLSSVGLGGFECWGDYARSPFEAAKSPDLLVLASKAG